MKKIIKLTESDLTRIVKRAIKEQEMETKGWSDENVANFMNDVLHTELERPDLDFNNLNQGQQIKMVRKYASMTADEDVERNLKIWLNTKIESKNY